MYKLILVRKFKRGNFIYGTLFAVPTKLLNFEPAKVQEEYEKDHAIHMHFCGHTLELIEGANELGEYKELPIKTHPDNDEFERGVIYISVSPQTLWGVGPSYDKEMKRLARVVFRQCQDVYQDTDGIIITKKEADV